MCNIEHSIDYTFGMSFSCYVNWHIIYIHVWGPATGTSVVECIYVAQCLYKLGCSNLMDHKYISVADLRKRSLLAAYSRALQWHRISILVDPKQISVASKREKQKKRFSASPLLCHWGPLFLTCVFLWGSNLFGGALQTIVYGGPVSNCDTIDS